MKTSQKSHPPGRSLVQPVKQPLAPPVYQPQPVPRVLQKKGAASASTTAQVKRQPTAPPVYRPQPVPKVLQQKPALSQQQQKETPSTPRPNAPPLSRTQPKKVVQPKANGAAQRGHMPRLPLPARRNVIQGDFKFGNKVVANPMDALGLLSQALAKQTALPVSQELMKTVLFSLPGKDLIDVRQLIFIYCQLEQVILERIKQAKIDAEHCLPIMKSPRNLQALRKIMSNPVPPGYARIWRGATPGQTMRILNHCTFGGAAPNMQEGREPPTEREAQLQTGDNVKTAEGGVLEEWSLQEGGLPGFASEGFMLVALVSLEHARLPPPHAMVGEMGVTGWQDQPLACVAVASPGRSLNLDPKQAYLDAVARFAKNIAGAKQVVMEIYARTIRRAPVRSEPEVVPPLQLGQRIFSGPERPIAAIPLPRGLDPKSRADFRSQIWGDDED